MTEAAVASEAMQDPAELLFKAGVRHHPAETYRELLERCPVARRRLRTCPPCAWFHYESVHGLAPSGGVLVRRRGTVDRSGTAVHPVQVDPPLHTSYRHRPLGDPLVHPRTDRRARAPRAASSTTCSTG